MQRAPVIAGNWKMHTTYAEAQDLAVAIEQLLSEHTLPVHLQVILCPPFPFLHVVAQTISHPQIAVGAQNLYPADHGAFTGEVSPPMLRSVGCQYVIIGHSERRQIFNESDSFIHRKLIAAWQHQLTPILCIGERWEDRQAGRTEEVILHQLQSALTDIPSLDAQRLLIAYEPVWAIGSGQAATPQQAQEAHQYIRQWIADHYGSDCADQLRLLYGGSVKPTNASALLSQPDIDGALVGGASLNAEHFTAIVTAAR